jgi:hypothetical protein
MPWWLFLKYFRNGLPFSCRGEGGKVRQRDKVGEDLMKRPDCQKKCVVNRFIQYKKRVICTKTVKFHTLYKGKLIPPLTQTCFTVGPEFGLISYVRHCGNRHFCLCRLQEWMKSLRDRRFLPVEQGTTLSL